MTAVSAQCHRQAIGCLNYTFSIAELIIQSAACRLKRLKGKQKSCETMYTCFHVCGDWTALTQLIRFLFLNKSSQSLQKIAHIFKKITVTVTEQRSLNLSIFLFTKVKALIAIHCFLKARYFQRSCLYISLQCKLVGKWGQIHPSWHLQSQLDLCTLVFWLLAQNDSRFSAMS